MSANPLLAFFQLAQKPLFMPYADIKPEHVGPAMDEILKASYADLEALEKSIEEKKKGGEKISYEFVAREVEALVEGLGRTSGAVYHLKSVCDGDELRKAVEAMQPKCVEFHTKVGQSRAIYDAWVAIAKDAAEYAKLNPSQKRIVDIEIRDGKLSGVDLEGAAKERFNVIAKRSAELGTKFSNNVMDSTKAFKLVLATKEDVTGLPESALALAAQSARTLGEKPEEATEKFGVPADVAAKLKGADKEAGPWVFTLDYPSYGPFMQYAERRDLREKLYKAFLTRASEHYEHYKPPADEPTKSIDNAPLIEEILKLREEKAKLVGFKHYAEVSMSKKMATFESATDLMEQLRLKSYDAGVKEYADVTTFAQEEIEPASLRFPAGEALKQWDVTFYAEKLKEAKYKFSSEELKPYFSLPKVSAGLWALTERLFNVKVVEVTADSEEFRKLGVSLWHEDVTFFKILSKETPGKVISYFFFDPYTRPATKKDGAWFNSVVGRSGNAKLVHEGLKATLGVEGSEMIRLPVGFMVCNQAPPVDGKPSLMTFREVETVFHEFGHSLQHMLTQENEGMSAGISNVDWDAVEQPSQFMENWCYDKHTVDSMAVHYETGEPIPAALFDKLLKAKTYRAASMMLRQLHFSFTDLYLHHPEYYVPSESDKKSVFDVQAAVSKKTDVMPLLPYDRFLCSFQHIFAGGYAAGYFSYKWAEVLSADCFGAFEEAGLDKDDKVKETGIRFRDTVLGMGGGLPPAEVFRLFRGRDPTADALLRHQGLLTAGGASAGA